MILHNQERIGIKFTNHMTQQIDLILRQRDIENVDILRRIGTCAAQNVTRIVTGNRKQEEILQDFSAYRHRFVFVDGYV